MCLDVRDDWREHHPCRAVGPNMLSKLARLGPAKAANICDFGRVSGVVRAERFWT